MYPITKFRHIAITLMFAVSAPALATVTINGSFSVPGDVNSGNASAESLVLATGAGSTCAAPKGAPSVAGAGNDRASSQHFMVNNGPARCVTVTVTRTATAEPLVVTFYASDGTVPELSATSSQYLADSGAGDGTGTVSFTAPAFSVIGALVQRKNASTTSSVISYTLASTELSGSSNLAQTLDSSDPTILGRLNRDGINITATQCRSGQVKAHPTVLDTGSTFQYRDHAFFNNGPARCIYVGVVNLGGTCPVFVQAYNDIAPTGTLTTSSNYLGDSGGSTIHQIAKFWAPQNSKVVVRVQQVLATSSPCTTSYTLTAPGLDTTVAAVPACSMDIDDDGSYSATTDGLLLTRALLGLSGTAVTAGALGIGANRNAWPAIRDFLRDACFLPVAN